MTGLTQMYSHVASTPAEKRRVGSLLQRRDALLGLLRGARGRGSVLVLVDDGAPVDGRHQISVAIAEDLRAEDRRVQVRNRKVDGDDSDKLVQPLV